MSIIKTKLSNGESVLIEVSTDSGDGKIGRIKEPIEIIDKEFDKFIQNQIIEHCSILVGSFEELKKQAVPPKKVTVEFGIQTNAEGNVYLAKISAQANFKISVEWNFEK